MPLRVRVNNRGGPENVVAQAWLMRRIVLNVRGYTTMYKSNYTRVSAPLRVAAHSVGEALLEVPLSTNSSLDCSFQLPAIGVDYEIVVSTSRVVCHMPVVFVANTITAQGVFTQEGFGRPPHFEPIVRAPWLRDETVPQCCRCSKPFSLFVRRHRTCLNSLSFFSQIF